jgi:Reverse transcriptase-like
MDRFTKRIRRVDVSDDEASYLGLIDILKFVGSGGRVDVITDSEKLKDQLHGKRTYKEPRLRELHNEVRRLVEERALEVEVKYVSRYNHPIRRLLNPLRDQLDRVRQLERARKRDQKRELAIDSTHGLDRR